jgi:hypothetical protein
MLSKFYYGRVFLIVFIIGIEHVFVILNSFMQNLSRILLLASSIPTRSLFSFINKMAVKNLLLIGYKETNGNILNLVQIVYLSCEL